jgi:hypothetical protein
MATNSPDFYQSNIFSDIFGVAWMPYYMVKVNGQTSEIAGFAK